MHNIDVPIRPRGLAVAVSLAWVAGMFEFLQSTSAQAVLWITALLVLCAIGAYVVLWFRDRSGDNRNSSSELLTGFRDLRDEGDISRGEFKKIKTVLGQKLQEELKSSDAEGEG